MVFSYETPPFTIHVDMFEPASADQTADAQNAKWYEKANKYEIAQFIKLNYHRIKYQLTRKLSLTPVSFISLSSHHCHGDDVHDEGNDPTPPLLGLSALTCFSMMSHTGGKLYLPPSLLRLWFRALI